MPRHGIAFPRQSSGLIHGAARGVRNAFKSRAELQREADRRRVDVCIEELLSVVDSPPGTEVNLDEGELMWICRMSREVFMEQPILLELDAPINVCGDSHGQYHDLLKILQMGGFPPDANYLFLGDYVDRARQSIETISLLLCYKIRYPGLVFLLRGNHECAALNRIYGFYDECKRRYSIKLWRVFGDCFNCMPVAAVVADRVLCMHGGLSPELETLDQIRALERPTDVPDDGLYCDLLWSDPDATSEGWNYSSRGVSYTFGQEECRTFLDNAGLDLICRAHQVVEDGYEFCFGRRLVTVFSAPNYCGEFDNAGGMMCIDANLCCSFKILRPAPPRLSMADGSDGTLSDDESASQDGSIDSFDPSKVISETKKKILDRDPTPNPGSGRPRGHPASTPSTRRVLGAIDATHRSITPAGPRAEDGPGPIKIDAAALGVDEKAFASPTASDQAGTVTPSDGISEASSDAGSNASSPPAAQRNVT